jgi:hypothetical protein
VKDGSSRYPPLADMLQIAYPNYSWDAGKFIMPYKPKGFWADVNNHKDTIEKIGRELSIEKVLRLLVL